LIVAGLAVAQRKLLGAWIYAGAFVGTAFWAFWEVGLNGWALVPRLGGPLLLLLLVILTSPVLDANRGRRRRLFGLGGFALIVIVLGVAVAQANRPDAPGAMPEPFAQAMADASLMQVGADWPAYGGSQMHEMNAIQGNRCCKMHADHTGLLTGTSEFGRPSQL
jgi:quinoprotein glucose dehydrogenase